RNFTSPFASFASALEPFVLTRAARTILCSSPDASISSTVISSVNSISFMLLLSIDNFIARDTISVHGSDLIGLHEEVDPVGQLSSAAGDEVSEGLHQRRPCDLATVLADIVCHKSGVPEVCARDFIGNSQQVPIPRLHVTQGDKHVIHVNLVRPSVHRKQSGTLPQGLSEALNGGFDYSVELRVLLSLLVHSQPRLVHTLNCRVSTPHLQTLPLGERLAEKAHLIGQLRDLNWLPRVAKIDPRGRESLRVWRGGRTIDPCHSGHESRAEHLLVDDSKRVLRG